MNSTSEILPAGLRAVLFDMDGTLVDSTALVEYEWTEWAKKKGLSAVDVARFSHGRRTEDVIVHYLGDTNLLEEIEAFRSAAMELDQSSVVPIPGAIEFVRSVDTLKWAVVTSAPANIAQKRLSLCGFPSPRVLISADDVKRGKPDPDGFMKAARNLGEPPENCVVFEDAPAGVSAGLSARMRVVVLRTTHPNQAFPGCIQIDDFRDLRVRISPSGRFALELL